MIPRAAPRLLLVSLLAAGLVLEWCRARPLWINLLVLGGFFLVWALAPRRDRRRMGPPFPPSKGAAFLLVAAAAALSAWPTLRLPYLADDYYFLEARGNTGSLWRTVSEIAPGEMWFRPVAWLPWRYYHKYFPADATAAHAVSVALFAANAGVAVLALRRCGAGRGAAVAAALLFAVSPAALETTAWITNQCSLFAGLFGAAAIATLPVGRPRAARMGLPCLFAALAFLSKEETFTLPALAVLVLARFRVRSLGRALAAAWPLFVVLAAVVGVRSALLGGIGGYRDPASGQSQLWAHLTDGPRAALESELPSRYLLPMRISLFSEAVYRWAPCLALGLLAYGGVSTVARRCVPRALWIAGLALAPVGPMLPIGDMIDEARWLYVPTLGISLATAALAAGGPLRGRASWIAIVGFAAASFSVARTDLFAWREAGAVLDRCMHALTPRLRALPEGSAAVVAGLPNQVQGAFCFITGKSYALTRAARPVNVRFPRAGGTLGPIAAAWIVDPEEGSVRDWLEGIPYLRLAPGDSYTFAPGTRVRDRLILEPYGAERRAGPAGVSYWSHYDDGLLLFPIFEVPPGSRFTWELNGGFLQPRGMHLEPKVTVTWQSQGKIERVATKAGEPVAVPADAGRVRLDVAMDQGLVFELRGFTVRLER